MPTQNASFVIPLYSYMEWYLFRSNTFDNLLSHDVSRWICFVRMHRALLFNLFDFLNIFFTSVGECVCVLNQHTENFCPHVNHERITCLPSCVREFIWNCKLVQSTRAKPSGDDRVCSSVQKPNIYSVGPQTQTGQN